MWKAVRLSAVSYPMSPVARTELERAGVELVQIEGQQPEEIIAAAADCDALLVVSSKLPAEVIQSMSRCRIIARLGAGTDKIDVAAATAAGIVVSNVPDFCLNEQAEHTLMLLLAFVRRLPYMTRAMQRGEWTARSHPDVHRIAGRTLGLVGFGASSQAVAERAKPFGLKLLAWTRSPDKYRAVAQRLGVELRELDDLLRASDFVSLHLPLNAETWHLLDERRLGLMRPGAVLVNTARGAIVDEKALVKALQEKRIGGAALDVFEGIDVFALPRDAHDPPQHPLLELDNVILTPHCAGSSLESTLDCECRGAASVADVLGGKWPRHVVNPQVQPRFPLVK
ncbi:MAG: C-terminal binding protein [Pirellulaceae bacterium]|nr:C-terminal binding protein [Pirellulaceae bacterium]